MPTLCKVCQEKKPDRTVRGTCQSPNYVPQDKLPRGHTPWTDSPNFSLCDACEEEFSLCAWCFGPLSGRTSITVPTNKDFCRQFEADNGNYVKGMYVGEQILVQMIVDLHAGIAWKVKSTSSGVKLAAMRPVTDGGQFGWQELYFDLNKAGQDVHIELEEVQSSWWGNTSSTGKTWRITIEVKQ